MTCKNMRPVGAVGNPLSRRMLLSGAATACLATAAVAAPVAMMQMEHPDAELLAAFEEWKRASFTAENLPDEMSEDDREPYWDKVWAARDRLAEIPARTLDGVAAKLSYLFPALTEGADSYNAIWHGTPPEDETLEDVRYRMFWELISNVKGLAAA